MNSSVPLQKAFGYGFAPAALLLIILITTLVITIVKKNQKDMQNTGLPPIKPPVFAKLNHEETRLLYLGRLNKLEKQLLDGKISPRACYQSMSLIFRKFIKDYTGQEMTNKTLTEINKMGINGVGNVVGEFYEPEFGQNPQADARAAITKTKRIIRAWN